MQVRSSYAMALLLAGLLLATEGCKKKSAVPVPAVPNSNVFKSPSGQTYTSTPMGELGPRDNDEPVTPPTVILGRPSGDHFAGSARAAAKLSMADGAPREFNDLSDLLDSLPSDASMRAQGISKDPSSGRLAEEMKLVTVTAFLYASSKEGDNDYHCVIGREPSQSQRFMNVEVSALPPAGSEFFAAIKAARDQFKAFFANGDNALPTGGYVKYDPPIPVRVTGSLFFDVDHVPPQVGPTGMKPATAWEIHPVKEMIFEPQTSAGVFFQHVIRGPYRAGF